MKPVLLVVCLAFVAPLAAAQTLTGSWTGSVDLRTTDGQMNTIRVLAEFEERSGGLQAGRLGPSSSQRFPLEGLRRSGRRLRFSASMPERLYLFDLTLVSADRLEGRVTARDGKASGRVVLERESRQATAVAATQATVPRTSAGANELRDAIGKGDAPAVARILGQDAAAAQARNEDGDTPLHAAARRDSAEIVKLLLNAGADPGARDAKGRTPLSWCIRFNSYRARAARLLVEAGAEASLSAEDRARLLWKAAEGGDREVVETLLKRGADPKTPNGNGGTLLHSAAAGGLEALVQRLLDGKFPVEGRDRYGLAPLHHAAAHGQDAVVSALLDRGADIDAVDPAGRTAFYLAEFYGRRTTADGLRARGAAQRERGPAAPNLPYFGQPLPGSVPAVFAPGIVSTFEWEHGTPSFSPDGSLALWTSCLHTSPYCAVFAAQRVNGAWTAPRLAPFASTYGESYPRISPDGTLVFFNSYRPVGPAGEDERRVSRLWVASRTKDGWSDPRPVRFGADQHPLEASAATQAASGRLYFSMYWKDGAGGFDIYVAEPRGSSGFAEPRLLEGLVNTRYDESIPWVSADERILLFNSGDRPGNLGDYDVYVCVRRADGSWSAPRNVGAPVNGQGMNWLPSMTADGRFLFFSSDRNGNMGDVFWVEARVLRTVGR